MAKEKKKYALTYYKRLVSLDQSIFFYLLFAQ